MRFLVELLLIITSFIGCVSVPKPTEVHLINYETPPNGILITENFYCDQTEMNNSGWNEYIFWTKRTFGAGSPEYQQTLPDTGVWLNEDNCLHVFAGSYLRGSSFQYHPVVGISQEQAEAYSNWRSDRVFEYFLVKNGMMQYDTAQTSTNYFTVEKYFKGQLNIAPDTNIYYPAFRLPTPEERSIIISYADSVDKAYFKDCNSKYCIKCRKHDFNIRTEIDPCAIKASTFSPTIPVTDNCSAKKGNPVFNLRGNVREWLADPNISAGGGWKDQKAQILLTDISQTSASNAWTGFRNVCEWKKWNP